MRAKPLFAKHCAAAPRIRSRRWATCGERWGWACTSSNLDEFASIRQIRLVPGSVCCAPWGVGSSSSAETTAGLERSLGRAPTPGELERALAPEAEDELLYRAAIARGYERDDPVVFRRLVQNLRFAGAPDARDDASLFAEALALHMHETDPVARRRLVSRMRLDLENEAPSAEPDEAALRAAYSRDAAAYQSPARLRCVQLYFQRDHERAARDRLVRLRADATPPERARGLGDPFLHEVEQPLQTRDELAARFGAPFADAVFAAPAGEWAGPIASSYGVHLVFVRAREAARALDFDEVRESLRHAVIADRRRAALERGMRALRERTQVIVDPRG